MPLPALFVALSLMPLPGRFAVFVPLRPTPLEQLAAREVRRYLYLRTGTLCPIEQRDTLPATALGVAISRRGERLAGELGIRVSGASPDAYRLKTCRSGRIAAIIGASDVASLYGAYAFCEKLGIGFYLHGETVPDRRVRLAVPKLDEQASPLFNLRGIQPFHDFAEGPDWWHLDDYLAIVDRLPKLRMNFIGLHTYSEPISEPTTWIGLPQDVRPDGNVSCAYPASYQNTLRGDWGYGAKPTSCFEFGASQLFESDAYGNDVMRGLCPKPSKPADCAEVFDREGRVLSTVFREAKALGVKTCIGTETPLTIPQRVKDRVRALGGDPTSAATRESVYEGIFKRIAATHPLDYYWLWTPEGWTWGGNSDADVRNTLDDMTAALHALGASKAPFRLATCGWVLGPQSDRALFGRLLPKDVAMSCINRMVGVEPVDPAFEQIQGREKWAIPWMEDDPALTAPQLWAGRMRRDAKDAHNYGCTGLMGIHWRTHAIAPNVLALALAAWDQSGWPEPRKGPFQAMGGQVASFGDPISGTNEPAIYRTVRWDVSSYRIQVPPGVYRVTLKFCEPVYDKVGKRVFDVDVDGAADIKGLDIFARVGRDKALDYVYDGVRVGDGVLKIGFTAHADYACIAGIVVEGPEATVKINCGGPAVGGYLSDIPEDVPRPGVLDLYRDWCRTEFGPEAAEPVAKLFAAEDGRLPRPLEWIGGPGGIAPDARPWSEASREYSFVTDFERFSSLVRGAGNRTRYDYWVKTFEYLREVAHLRCLWGKLEGALKAKDADLTARAEIDLRAARRKVTRLLLATVGTTGEMGTVANWQQHDLPAVEDVLERADAFTGRLGRAAIEDGYEGPTRIIVPTVRGRVDPGVFHLKVIVLSADRSTRPALHWRPMGRGAFRAAPLRHVARGVYRVDVPAKEDFEYYVTDGSSVWPATAPSLNQTVLVLRLQR